ncbi:ATP-binding protein [Ornithinimicrobium pekingense]|uniref:Adenylate cyclase n=1 Tax=Ornithinimicrobium pekingense TaxID=384677 RepID=A0ABQ2F9N9_9MICO|nr:adenylate/guanylate cyclase domain-containing protein [Ornithinimicrobium pekingense]GGK75117.1 adenylate cyclase [Ornithinimicrobium pekingense]
MVETGTSAESRLGSLLDRLVSWAEVSLRAGDLEQARATAEEVRAVDPDNQRAASVLQRIAARQTGPWGERALMTLLFSDLVGSTQLSEQVEPEQMRDLFAFYRAAVGAAVRRYGGSLVQFYGDGVLAGFGYPEVHEDDARRAVLAGLDMVVAMRDGRAELQRRVGASADLRVGIHTGRVVITGTDTGTDVLSRDSILGVTPNLAARVQGAGEPGMVVVSDVTHELVDADFFTRSLGEHRLRGITRPVEIFAVERPRYAAARFTADRYRQAGLVGREEPAARLTAAWDTLLEQREAPGLVFLLGGEAGIGKSRLVVELLDRVQARGGRVVGAGCLPYYSNVPLWPVARMLARTVGAGDQSAEAVPSAAALEKHLAGLGLDLPAFVPVLGPLLQLPASTAYPPLELDPSAVLELTQQRLVEWLAALAARDPHLLVVEDLHWADPTTLELLRRLTEQPPPALLTVVTTREPDTVPWREQVVQIELGRLDEEASLRLVANLSAGSGAELPEPERAEIVGQAQGNPLFLEELTRSSLTHNRTEPIPLRLQELFTWRLKEPGVDRRIVQVAATVGPVFRASVVAAVVGDEPAVTDQLELLLERGVLETTPAAGTYRFRHALMRDAAYETQVLDVRQDTHAAVADVMAASGTEPALVATHLDLAGLADRAAALYLVAAQASQARGAHQEATRLATRALELYAEMDASEERDLGELGARMLRILSVSSLRGYAAPEVKDDHDRAEQLAQGLGTRPEVLASVVGIYSYRLTNGDVPTALGLAERLLTMTRHRALSWFQPEVDGCAGYAHLYLGHLPTAQSYFERSVQGLRSREEQGEDLAAWWPLPNDPCAAAEVGLACVAALRGEPAVAARHEAEAIRRAEALGFPRGPFTIGFVKTYIAWIRQFQGDPEAARAVAADILAVGQRHGYAYWMVLGSAYLAGPPDGAPDPAYLASTVQTLRMMGHEAFLASMLSSLAAMSAQAGDLARAVELVDDALATAHRTGEMLHVPEILRRRAAFALARGLGAAEAVPNLLAAVALATEQGAAVSRLRAAVDLAQLPPQDRPTGWRETLVGARAAVPATYSSPETEAADHVLAP